ncbi:hypothetical protein [Leuconostoc mesenteroides]
MITENIIQAFAIAGGFGFINVLTLEQIGVQTFDDKSNRDRNIMLFSFSAFNYLLYTYSNSVWITILFSCLITVLSIIILVIGFPVLRGLYDKVWTFEKSKKIMKHVKFTQKNSWDDFVTYAEKDNVSTYAFSFDDKFIAGGEISSASNSLEDHSFFMNTYEKGNRWNIENKQQLDDFLKKYNPLVEIYVDMTTQTKFYSLSEDEE